MRGIRLLSVLLLLAAVVSLSAQSYDDMLAQTDRSDPDSLYELVVWCQKNGFYSSANEHIREILALDENHAPTRELQGFVWDGRRWVHRSRLPGGGRQDKDKDDEGGSVGRASGPGPKASDIEWNMQVPADPDKEGRLTNFLNGVIDSLNRSRSGDWATLIMDGQRASGMSLFKKAIKEGRHTSLHAALQITQRFLEEKDMPAAQSMLPFLMHLSTKSKNAEDLALFAYVVSQFGNKKVIPRLIELLDHPDEDVQFNAKYAIGQFMARGVDAVNKEEAQEWWDRFHNAPNSVIYGESLSHRDSRVRLSAVESITVNDWDDRIIPVLIELIREGGRIEVIGAAQQLERITGSNWDISMNMSADQRKLIAERLQEWWEDNRGGFRPLYLRQQRVAEPTPEASQADRMAAWVQQLGDIEPSVASNATSQIRGQGDDAIPALIDHGLASSNGIVRNRARDLLREITGQNFGFDGLRGTDDARAQARQQWQQWAEENGFSEE